MQTEKNKQNHMPLDNEYRYDIRNNPWKTVVIYIFFGFAWILFSDKVLELFAQNPREFAQFQTYKGWFYVVLTAILLYFLIRLDNRKIYMLSRDLRVKNQELTSFSEEMIAKEDELEVNIEQLNKSMEALERNKNFIDEIFNSTYTFILLWDLQGEVIDINEHFLEALQYSKEEVMNDKFERLIHPDEQFSFDVFIKDLFQYRVLTNMENRIVTKTGAVLDVLWNDKLITNPDTEEDFIASFGIDITNKKANESKIHDMAFKDKLTGLKNRVVFENEIGYLISEEKPFAIIYLDFDNFKNVNEVYGHEIGDRFLSTYSRKLVETFEDLEVYRWAGDEFVLLQLTDDIEALKTTLDQLQTITKCRWNIGKMEYYPSLSAGIARYPSDGSKSSELLKNVEMALYKSKDSGKSQAKFYEKHFEKDMQRLVYVENAISSVLQTENFQLFYQPIYELNTMVPIRLEALLRWKSAYNDVSTGEFIEVAEKTGQILEIDQWVIKNAFNFSAKHFCDKQIKIAVNLSAKSLKSDVLVSYIENVTNASQVNPHLIEFEITEHTLIENFEHTLAIVNRLREMGFGISLDDFGTRYSSLDYLRKIPFDTLKIDKSYIDKVSDEGKDRIIVEEIIRMANLLGLTTVAEGIETLEQRIVLEKLGCQLGQGYLMSRPVNETAVLELLDEMR